LVAAYFYFLNKPLREKSLAAFGDNEASSFLFSFFVVAVVLETVGTFLKRPALAQIHHRETPALATSSWIKKRLGQFAVFWLGLGTLGRLPVGAFLGIIGVQSLTGMSVKESGWAQLIFAEELLRAFVIIGLIWWIKTKHFKKIDTDSPPTSFMVRDFVGDLCLTLFSALSFSMVWAMVGTGDNFNKITVAQVDQTIWAIIVFGLLYMPANLIHFKLHLANIAKESQTQWLLYWGTWMLTLYQALAPLYV